MFFEEISGDFRAVFEEIFEEISGDFRAVFGTILEGF